MTHRRASAYDTDEMSLAPKDDAAVAVEEFDVENDESKPRLNSSRALWAWAILSFAIGPTQSMVYEYLLAALQSVANSVGHVPDSDEPCATKGMIHCVVQLGGSEVDYLSYSLYIGAIAQALEGVASIVVAGLGDFSNNRKLILVGNLFALGLLGLPFAGLAGRDYTHLNALAAMYILISVTGGVLRTVTTSFLPLFMKSHGWSETRADKRKDEISKSLARGTKVNVIFAMAFNLGAIVALVIGTVIAYARQVEPRDRYTNFLLATTASSCVTLVFTLPGSIMLPNVQGAPIPSDQNIWLLPFRVWQNVLRSIPTYPNAFKLCCGWVVLTTGTFGFQQLTQALFLETTGIQQGSSLFTVYSLLRVIYMILGALLWLLFSKRVKPRTFAFCLLACQVVCISWGCAGVIPGVDIGYKHEAEFWIAEFVMTCTTGALLSLHPVMLAMMIPSGAEAAFFGMQNIIHVATGWLSPLIQGSIQNATHNPRFAMVQNLVLIFLAVGFYAWTNVEQGTRDAQRPLDLVFSRRGTVGKTAE